jgi:hypothetical protein
MKQNQDPDEDENKRRDLRNKKRAVGAKISKHVTLM